MFLILLLHLSYLGLGLLIISLIFKHEEYPYSFRLLIAYFVGVFANVLFIHIAIIATLTSPLISWSFLIIGMAGLACEIRFVIKTNVIKLNAFFSSPKNLILNISITILLIPVLYLITLKLVGLPDVTYDSTAFWNLKAKFFFYGEHLLTDAFMNTNRVHPNRDYPLYMPIFIFEHFSIIGTADDWLTKYGTWIYYTSGMILFFMIIRQWTGTKIALLATIFMLYSPLYSYNSIQGSITNTYMDFPLSLMIAASVGLFLRYQFHRNPLDIFGASVFVASAILLKREGAVWFILFVSFALLAMVFTRKKIWQNEYAWLILPILVFICWQLIRTRIPPPISDIQITTYAEHITSGQVFSPSSVFTNLSSVFTKMIKAWLISIFKIRLWGLFPIFVIPYFVFGLLINLRNLTILLTASMVLGYLGGIFLALMLIDLKTGGLDGYMIFAYPRLIIQLLPVSLLLAIFMNSNKFTNRLVTFKSVRI